MVRHPSVLYGVYTVFYVSTKIGIVQRIYVVYVPYLYVPYINCPPRTQVQIPAGTALLLFGVNFISLRSNCSPIASKHSHCSPLSFNARFAILLVV